MALLSLTWLPSIPNVLNAQYLVPVYSQYILLGFIYLLSLHPPPSMISLSLRLPLPCLPSSFFVLLSPTTPIPADSHRQAVGCGATHEPALPERLLNNGWPF